MPQDTFAPNSAAVVVSEDFILPKGAPVFILEDNGGPTVIYCYRDGATNALPIGGGERRHFGQVTA